MILRSDRSPDKAGVSLFEVMVTLAVLGFVLTVTLAALRQPSPKLQAAANIGSVMQDAQAVRLDAIARSEEVLFPTEHLCSGARTIVFFADGTGRGGPLCVGAQRLELNPFTGFLRVEK